VLFRSAFKLSPANRVLIFENSFSFSHYPVRGIE